MTRILPLLLASFLAAPLAADEMAEAVADLVAQLEDERWDVREGASRRLASLLPDALPHLLAALESGGPETRARILAVLGPIRVDGDGRIRQWAISAAASSEYTSEGWSALQATGEPDTTEAGDQPTAWASRESDAGLETLDLAYRYPVRPARLLVHESYNPGAVVRVEAEGAVLWEGRDPTAAPSGVLEIPLAAGDPVREIRLVLDTRFVAGWNEIDAVELVGESPAPRSGGRLPTREEIVRATVAEKRAEIERLRETIRRLEEEIRELEK